MLRAAEIGQEAGLNYVYAGNMPGRVGEYENTYCPHCRAVLVERYSYIIQRYHMTARAPARSAARRLPGCGRISPSSVRLDGSGHAATVIQALSSLFTSRRIVIRTTRRSTAPKRYLYSSSPRMKSKARRLCSLAHCSR